MLSSVQDDEKATHIAINVMLKLWKPATSNMGLPKLSEWFTVFEAVQTRFAGTIGPLDKTLVEQAQGIVKEFFQEEYAPMLMHGDLHHFNILSSERGWIAIDPKGVLGPAAYEFGPLLINPHNLSPESLARFASRRIAIITERLGFEKERILKWAFAHAVL
jgi:streptomycin 6-kinase